MKEGRLSFDASKPEGVQCKLLDSGRLNPLGSQARQGLVEGLGPDYDDRKMDLGQV
jgi:hypothetical protein